MGLVGLLEYCGAKSWGRRPCSEDTHLKKLFFNPTTRNHLQIEKFRINKQILIRFLVILFNFIVIFHFFTNKRKGCKI